MYALLLAELPQWLENLSNDVGTAWPLVILIATAYGLIRWTSNKFKHEVRAIVKEETSVLQSEVTTNGGKSIKDKVNSIDQKMDDLILSHQEAKDQSERVHADIYRALNFKVDKRD